MPTIDIDDLRRRIVQIRRGELPQDAVSAEELREALEQVRTDRKAKLSSTGSRAAKSTAAPALPSITGGLLERMKQLETK